MFQDRQHPSKLASVFWPPLPKYKVESRHVFASEKISFLLTAVPPTLNLRGAGAVYEVKYWRVWNGIQDKCEPVVAVRAVRVTHGKLQQLQTIGGAVETIWSAMVPRASVQNQ